LLPDRVAVRTGISSSASPAAPSPLSYVAWRQAQVAIDSAPLLSRKATVLLPRWVCCGREGERRLVPVGGRDRAPASLARSRGARAAEEQKSYEEECTRPWPCVRRRRELRSPVSRQSAAAPPHDPLRLAVGHHRVPARACCGAWSELFVRASLYLAPRRRSTSPPLHSGPGTLPRERASQGQSLLACLAPGGHVAAEVAGLLQCKFS